MDGSWPTGNCSYQGATGQYTCTPDPGSKPADCEPEEADLEFVTIGDFSKGLPDPDPKNRSKADHWYVYIDKSGTGRISSFSKGWSTPLHIDPSPLCGKQVALHIQGGPFWGWGGGFGTSAKDWLRYPESHDDNAFNCFKNPDSSLCPKADVPEYLSGAMVDVSEYEGVAIWARRGPDSQGGVRVNVGDQYTDDDISYLTYQKDPQLPRRCERVRECACTNHKECMTWEQSPLDNPKLTQWSSEVRATSEDFELWSCRYAGTYCEDPESGIVPGYQATDGPQTRCNTCGITRCEEPYEAYPDGVSNTKDMQFNGRPCTPFTSRSGIASSYCYDPQADPTPAEADEQCGDHWIKAIYLTTDWKLYRVPFTSMLQQGFAKKQAKLDLKHVTVVRLTWDGGYIDYWISKIAFYRHKSHP